MDSAVLNSFAPDPFVPDPFAPQTFATDPFNDFFDFLQNGPNDNEFTIQAGMKLEVKKFDVRKNSKGDKTVLQTGKKYQFPKATDEDNESALSTIKIYDDFNQLINTETVVRSPHIIRSLQEVIARYPGINLDAEVVVISGQPWCLFHYYRELAEYGRQLSNKTAKDHVLFALNYMKTTFASDLIHYQNCMRSRGNRVGLDWERLWMAYRPGDLIFSKENDTVQVGRLIMLSRYNSLFSRFWDLQLETIVCTGSTMEYRRLDLRIPKYSGIKPFRDLKAYPLRYHPDHESIRRQLIERGKRLFHLQGVHQKYYRGNAKWARDPAPGKEDWYDEESGDYPFSKFQVRSRIMIDTEGFKENRPNHIGETYSESKVGFKDANEQSEEHHLICDNEVLGYSLIDKRWCAFRLDLVEDIKCSERAFDGLLLPSEQKETILSLVRVHTNETLKFNDLIQEKGKGMIFLLHGEPGVGKTLTAEGISDYVKRPLFPLRSGDLGIEPQVLEKNLNEAFELAARWNAIILLDEADVFLEERRRNELLRNSLVTVFLRVLEYYEGIMFLTTNRIDAFDPAFRSRIHLSIKYYQLDWDCRYNLWSEFVKNGTSNEVDPSATDEAFLIRLADLELNGRQIRNTVRTAYALALSANKPLGAEHIETTLKAMNTFDQDSKDIARPSVSSGEEDWATSSRRPQKRRRVD